MSEKQIEPQPGLNWYRLAPDCPWELMYVEAGRVRGLVHIDAVSVESCPGEWRLAIPLPAIPQPSEMEALKADNARHMAELDAERKRATEQRHAVNRLLAAVAGMSETLGRGGNPYRELYAAADALEREMKGQPDPAKATPLNDPAQKVPE